MSLSCDAHVDNGDGYFDVHLSRGETTTASSSTDFADVTHLLATLLPQLLQDALAGVVAFR